MARPIIIDTDPGIDDAVAILLALAAPELEVLGLVAVAGNLPLGGDRCATRAPSSSWPAAPKLPVFAGCPRPIGPGGRAPSTRMATAASAIWYCRPRHGRRARSTASSPDRDVAAGRAPQRHAVRAGAADQHRDGAGHGARHRGRIAELVLMGGGTRGNMTAVAEFNIHADPHAAALVFDSGLPITMVPLDVTETVRRYAGAGRADRRAWHALRRRRGDADRTAPRLGQPPMAMHDPCVIAYLLRRSCSAGGASMSRSRRRAR